MKDTSKLTLSALFVCLGVLVPMAFHAVGLGKIFLPMHVPVLLSGLLCGPALGFTVGFVTPILSAVLTGMPPLMPPTAQTMMVELGAYGALTGVFHRKLGWGVYPALLGSMAGGRIVYGLAANWVFPLFGVERLPMLYPLTYGLATGIPGLLLQLALIPAIMCAVSGRVDVLVKKAAVADAPAQGGGDDVLRR